MHLYFIEVADVQLQAVQEEDETLGVYTTPPPSCITRWIE